MDEDILNRLLAENLKIMRNYLNLKREIVILRIEREDREHRFITNQKRLDNIINRFYSLEKSYENIKEMQNDLSYQNSILISKIRKLEDLNKHLIEENTKKENEI